MIVACTKCNTNYNLDVKNIKNSSLKVRCSKCKYIFEINPKMFAEETINPVWQDSDTRQQHENVNEEDKELLNNQDEIEEDQKEELDFAIDDKKLDVEGDAAVEEEDAASAVGSNEDEEEFSLDLDIEEEDAAVEEKAAASALGSNEDEEEFSLDLDIEEEDAAVEEKAAASAVGSNEDEEEFSLDLDIEETNIELQVNDGEVDLSEVEQVIKSSEKPRIEQEVFSEGTEGKTGAEEINLSEIEEIIDIEGNDDFEDDNEVPEELKLDIDEDDSEEKTISMDDSLELEAEELDLTDIEVIENDEKFDDFPYEVTDIDDNINDKALESTIEVQNKDNNTISSEKEIFSETKKVVSEVELVEDEIGTEDETERSSDKADKKSFSKLVLWAIILLLFCCLSFASLYVLNHFGVINEIKLPKIVNYFSSNKDNKKLSATDTKYEAINNAKAGKMLKITGRVKNEYEEPISFVKIVAKLYSKAGVIAEETVYCGNNLTDTELIDNSFAEIKKRLSNMYGDNNINFNLQPKQEIPFLVVFSNLSQNIQEYTVEVLSSSPGNKSR